MLAPLTRNVLFLEDMGLLVTDLFSQQILPVGGACTLRCLFCRCWPQPLEPKPKKPSIRPTSAIFEKFPKKRIFHILGGEPLLYPALPRVLNFLRQEKCRIFLWTNLIVPGESLISLRKLVDVFFVHLPAVAAEDYLAVAGCNGRATLTHNLALLQDYKSAVVLNYPVRPDNVRFVPEAYELALKYRVPLLLHYSKHANFSPESLAYVQRFYNVAGVYVLRSGIQAEGSCAAFPGSSIRAGFQVSKNLFHELVNKVRSY